MTGGLHVVTRPADGTGDPGAPPVVVVHGAMDRASSFGRLAKRLRDLDVIAYDRRGYAGSFDRGPSTCFDHQVDDLLEVLDGAPAVLVGHSYGGNVVLAVAAEHPQLVPSAVVFEAPAPWEPWWPDRSATDGRDPAEVAERFMRRMVGERTWGALPASTRAARRAEGATMLAEVAALGAVRPYDPAAVRAPVVVGWGAGSPEHLRQAARQLVDDLPDATGVEVAGSSHGVHLTHPGDLAALVRAAVAAA
ncbi:MAG TPA: alpha/beta hydrolase [Acidimicrobiales bacterium]|nr:alpha/beta hydrolase [Acidimicrobiales bacterium]